LSKQLPQTWNKADVIHLQKLKELRAMIVDEKSTRLIRTPAEKIKNDYGPQKIILFGSYACGTPDPGSIPP
jgi:predicted nucleotidyltransferase